MFDSLKNKMTEKILINQNMLKKSQHKFINKNMIKHLFLQVQNNLEKIKIYWKNKCKISLTILCATLSSKQVGFIYWIYKKTNTITTESINITTIKYVSINSEWKISKHH